MLHNFWCKHSHYSKVYCKMIQTTLPLVTFAFGPLTKCPNCNHFLQWKTENGFLQMWPHTFSTSFSMSMPCPRCEIQTHPQRLPPASAELCSLQWSRTWVQPACSKPPPAGSCRSPAAPPPPWPEPSGRRRRHLTCMGTELRTWETVTGSAHGRERIRFLCVLPLVVVAA